MSPIDNADVRASSSTPCGGSGQNGQDSDGVAVLLQRNSSDSMRDAIEVKGGPSQEKEENEEESMPHPINVQAGIEGNGEGRDRNGVVEEEQGVLAPIEGLRTEKRESSRKESTKKKGDSTALSLRNQGFVRKPIENTTTITKERPSTPLLKNAPKCPAKYRLNDSYKGIKCELTQSKGSDSGSLILPSKEVIQSATMRRSHPNFTVPHPFKLATDKRASLGGHFRSKSAQDSKTNNTLGGDKGEHVKCVENMSTKKVMQSRVSYANSLNCSSDMKSARRRELSGMDTTSRQSKKMEELESEKKQTHKSPFKAIPLPSFYQDPVPPKIEIKKKPTTRPKSPKLGRKISSCALTSESVGCSPRSDTVNKASSQRVLRTSLSNNNDSNINKKKPLEVSQKAGEHVPLKEDIGKSCPKERTDSASEELKHVDLQHMDSGGHHANRSVEAPGVLSEVVIAENSNDGGVILGNDGDGNGDAPLELDHASVDDGRIVDEDPKGVKEGKGDGKPTDDIRCSGDTTNSSIKPRDANRAHNVSSATMLKTKSETKEHKPRTVKKQPPTRIAVLERQQSGDRLSSKRTPNGLSLLSDMAMVS